MNKQARENYFSPISPDGASGPPQAFLEFLQRGKFSGAQKSPGQQQAGQPPQRQHDEPKQSKSDNNQAGQIHSVEELEARMRQSGPPQGNQLSPSSGMRNIQQQDMLAFKKILEQISNDGSSPQPQPEHILQQTLQHQQHSALNLMQMLNKNNHGILNTHQQVPVSVSTHHHPQQQQQQQLDEFKKMFPFGPPVHPQGGQQPRQLNNQIPEGIKNIMMEQPAPMAPPQYATQQNRIEILKRPEAQALIQRKQSFFFYLFTYISIPFMPK